MPRRKMVVGPIYAKDPGPKGIHLKLFTFEADLHVSLLFTSCHEQIGTFYLKNFLVSKYISDKPRTGTISKVRLIIAQCVYSVVQSIIENKAWDKKIIITFPKTLTTYVVCM